MSTRKTETDIKKLYPITMEKSMIASLLLIIAFFLLCPAPKPKTREQRPLYPGFIVEDVPVTQQGGRVRPPSRPSIPIPVDELSMAEDETIEPSVLDFDFASGGQGGYRPGGVPVLPPRLLVQVMPEFPAQEKKRGISGTILLHIQVSKHGKVEAVVVLENSTGSELCVEAAIKAAKKSQYQPARQGTRSVAAWTTCSYVFHP